MNITRIENARITINSTSNYQSNCSTCICQCLTYSSSPTAASSSCCYVNCYLNNNTCQIIISSSINNSAMIIDKTTTVYKTNCFNNSNTNNSPGLNSGGSLITDPNDYSMAGSHP